MKMNSYKTEPILLVPSLVDEDCKRFCFESCRLYDQVLHNVCIAVQRECDCIQKKIAYRNTQLHPFLSTVPSQESCKKYCEEGSCQKYFKLDSSTFSECVGAIILCSCSSTIIRFHSELTSVKVAEHLVGETTSSTRFLIGLLAILVVCLILATLVGVYLWKNNNGRRIGILEQRLQPDCNVGNGNVRLQINTHEDIGIGTDEISSHLRTTGATQAKIANHDENVNVLMMENQVNNNSVNAEFEVQFKTKDLLKTSSSYDIATKN